MVKKPHFFYGWVIVITFLISGIAIYGIRFSYGVFFKSIATEFSLTRTAASSVFSVSLLVSGIFAFLLGWALDKYGPKVALTLMGLFTGIGLITTSMVNSLWQLYITYSLLLAMGLSGIFTVPMSTVSRWFDKKRGLAAGIASSGIGLGTFIMAPFATYILINFNWRISFIIIGLMAWIIIIPISRLLKKSPYVIGALPDGVRVAPKDIANNFPLSTGLSLREAIRTRSFWVIIFLYLFFSSTFLFIMAHLIPHVTDVGFSAMEAATVFSLMGIVAIAGRILMGITSDRIGRRTAVVICALLQSVAVLWLIWANDLWMLQLFAVVYGFAFSGMGPSLAALISDTFGLRKIGAIIGALDVGFGLGAAIGPAVGGLVFDAGNSYSLAFLTGAAAMFLAAVLVTQIRRAIL